METQTQQGASSAPTQPVKLIDDDAATVYKKDGGGYLTVGEIVHLHDAKDKELRETKQTIEIRDRELAAIRKQFGERLSIILNQSARIETLEKENRDATSALSAAVAANTDLQIKLSATVRVAESNVPEMQRLSDGGLRLMVTVPVDQATPLLSWAADAGCATPEAIQEYVQKQLEEALIAVVSS